MTINKSNLAWLCFVWSFALLLGLSFGLNVPLVLMIVGTVLLLLA
jgi:hypothetical protein